jgi:hypothetical protein
LANSAAGTTLERLIAARDCIVTDYGQLPLCRELTSDVSAFPGGSGFLDREPGNRSFMLVMHNYDGSENALKPENYNSAFWLTLEEYLTGAKVERSDVFLTNYYMGLRPGSAVGEMASLGGPHFAAQCRRFFNEQIRIIDPSLVIVLGNHAWKALADWTDRPKVYVAHPSSNRDANVRKQRAAKWIRAIKNALTEVRSST